jgi:hypothetical protein
MMKQVMVRAWELAKDGATKFGGSSKEYFAASLSIAWSEVKKVEQNEIELIGTEKQVKWAKDIIERIEKYREVLVPHFITFMDEHIALPKNAEIAEKLKAAKEHGLEVMRNITKNTDAKYYIDRYGRFLKDISSAQRVFAEVYDRNDVEYTQIEKFTQIGLKQAVKKATWIVRVELEGEYDPDFDRKTGKWKV